MNRPVLVIAHPGHELRILGWLERARPLVCVLTDGSGSQGEARVASTSAVLAQTSSRAGPLYGRLSDREIYAAILNRNAGYFLGLADELADSLVAESADYVVSDAIEGFNPSHDVCRLITDASVRIARRRSGRAIPAFDFLLEGPPDTCPPDRRDDAIWVRLDDAALSRKLAMAHSYSELRSEIERTLATYGSAPFKTECLCPADTDDRRQWNAAEVPYYERYGAQRVAAGVYESVVRFREHMQPIAEALQAHGESAS